MGDHPEVFPPVAMGHDRHPYGSEPYLGAGEQDALTHAVAQLRAEVAGLMLPYEIPGAGTARQERRAVLDRLDNYVLPRVGHADIPLLVVIGGSTGAGKSTLTNSLIGSDISPTGFLRPTTRSPVVIHHPNDTPALMSPRVLPDLPRTSLNGTLLSGAGPAEPSTSLRLVPHRAMPPGLAIIDSPDLDSVADMNRTVARQLFQAADMWIFVTTGTDYADAVPWELLVEAVERRMAVAVVLDRMREGEMDPVRLHFATMLSERGLTQAPVFTLPEARLIDGLLPARLVEPLRNWLDLQSSEAVRMAHIERTMGGTLKQVLDRVPILVAAATDQVASDHRLRVDLEALFSRARQTLLARAVDGSAIGEPVRAAWRPFTESTEAGAARLRRRMTAVLRGNTGRYAEPAQALRHALGAMVMHHVEEAANALVARWRSHPGNTEPGGPRLDLVQVSPEFWGQADRTLYGWQIGVLEWVRPGAGRHGPGAADDPLALAVTTLAVGADGEVGSAASALLSSEAPATDPRPWIAGAREELLRRLNELIGQERTRIRAVLDESPLWSGQGQALQAAAQAVRDLA